MSSAIWEFGKLATFRYGKMPNKKRVREDGKYPVFSGYRYVGRCDEYNTDAGVLVIVARGVGGTGNVKLTEEKCFLTNLSIAADVDCSLALPEYLYYYFLINNLRWLDSGSAQSQITISDLKKVLIPVPSIKEQKSIVSYLRLFDKKIETNEHINQNLKYQAQAIFKSWFVDFEPFGKTIPSEWEYYTLGSVTTMNAGGDKPKDVSPDKNDFCQYPIYSNGLENEGLYGYTSVPKIKQESVTVSARGTIGFVCLRHIPYVPIVRLISLIPENNYLSAKYLYLYLKQLNITGTGTTQQQLTVPDFRKTKILIPNLSVMNSFTDIVTPIFNEIWANEEENQGLADLRDALLPKLMSGELDVSAIGI